MDADLLSTVATIVGLVSVGIGTVVLLASVYPSSHVSGVDWMRLSRRARANRVYRNGDEMDADPSGNSVNHADVGGADG